MGESGRKVMAGREGRMHAPHTMHSIWVCPYVTVSGTRKQCLPDPTGQQHIRIYSNWDSMHKSYLPQLKPDNIPSWRGWASTPSPSKGGLAIDSCWEWESQLFVRCSLSDSSEACASQKMSAVQVGLGGLKKGLQCGGLGRKSGSGRSGVNMIKIFCRKFFQYLQNEKNKCYKLKTLNMKLLNIYLNWWN